MEILGPRPRTGRLAPGDHGYHGLDVDDAPPGTRYALHLDGGPPRPDPASRFQPEGVHGPSEVVDPRGFRWTDQDWRGLPLHEHVIYELHVGTFTRDGTFDAVIGHVPELRELGVTALELMPVAQFPGARNWGYDGLGPFAVQNTYGGPEGLRRLVDAAHRSGMAILLDVVYNHLGPEGNHHADFGPYFTDEYRTPWGVAINFDGRGSDEVRHYFISNAVHWLDEYHLDGLRLDAVHAIHDRTARPFLEELAEACHAAARTRGIPFHLVAESVANEPRLIRGPDEGGLGLDAVWNDDFHHALHSLLTGETTAHYRDFGTLAHLAKTYTHGFVLDGQYSHYRGRRHGRSSLGLPAHRLVIAVQTHDQVGNRSRGQRLGAFVPFEGLKLSAAAMLAAPSTPLLFMGEEYAETAPFQYFTSHSLVALREAVRTGRREEFKGHGWTGDMPEPDDEATFLRSKLHHELKNQGHHRALREFYRELLRLRATRESLARGDPHRLRVQSHEDAKVLLLHRWSARDQTLLVLHLANVDVTMHSPVPAGPWRRILDSADERWAGPGTRLEDVLPPNGAALLKLRGFQAAFWGSAGGIP